jgi:hypothetical protein
MLAAEPVIAIVDSPEITEGQLRYQSAYAQQEALKIQRKGIVFDRMAAIGTGGLALIALAGALAAWARTGRIQPIK